MSAVPRERSDVNVVARRWKLLTGVLAVFVVGTLFNTALTIVAGGSDVDLDDLETVGAKGIATQVARDWADGRITAVPSADGVSGDFRRRDEDRPQGLDYYTLTWTGIEEGSTIADGAPYERHRFAISATDYREDADRPALLELTVTLRTDADVPVLAAQPSLAAAPNVDGERYAAIDLEQEAEATEGRITEAIREQVDAWAQALAEDDRSALKSLTGDGRPGTVYRGIGGFTASASSVRHPTASSDGEFLLVQARVSLVRAQGWEVTSDYDLLIAEPTTDLPKIVAWGPAGEAPELEPYQNAVTD